MNRSSSGFTLIELAIVLVILTLLIGGLAVPLSAQIQARRIAETRKTLDAAQDALTGYALSHRTVDGHPYLPCPDVSGNGRENRNPLDGVCVGQVGFLPWVTLGVGNMDAWGNRLRYAVVDRVSRNASGFGVATTTPPDASWLQVCSSNACASGDLAENVPAVVVSHGPNGWGARNAINGAPLAAPTGTNEQENLDTDSVYVSQPPYRPEDGSPAELAREFDDLTAWIAYPVLLLQTVGATSSP